MIVYVSRIFRLNERFVKNMSSFKLELLVFKWSVIEKFRDYLLGNKFVVLMDNNFLKYLFIVKFGVYE